MRVCVCVCVWGREWDLAVPEKCRSGLIPANSSSFALGKQAVGFSQVGLIELPPEEKLFIHTNGWFVAGAERIMLMLFSFTLCVSAAVAARVFK